MDQQTSKRILVIEDNQSFRKMLKMRLNSQQLDTIVAADGLEGLDLAKREMPDLIITDLMLPGLDGHKICRILKYDKKYAHIPVVMLTSRDLDEDEELAKKCGADAFLVKTTRAEVIMDVINHLLTKK